MVEDSASHLDPHTIRIIPPARLTRPRTRNNYLNIQHDPHHTHRTVIRTIPLEALGPYTPP